MDLPVDTKPTTVGEKPNSIGVRLSLGFCLVFVRVFSAAGISWHCFRERQLVSLMSFSTSAVKAAVSSESEAKSLARPRLSKM